MGDNQIFGETSSEMFRNFIEQYEKKFSSRFGNRFLVYNGNKVFRDASEHIKSMSKEIDDTIVERTQKKFVVEMSRYMVQNLKQLYDELMDLGGKENVLLKSLIAIGAVVRHKLMKHNEALRNDLITTMMANKSEEELSNEEMANIEAKADEVLDILQKSFRTDLHDIYNEIKRQINQKVELTQDEEELKKLYQDTDNAINTIVQSGNQLQRAYDNLNNKMMPRVMTFRTLDDILLNMKQIVNETGIIDVYGLIDDEDKRNDIYINVDGTNGDGNYMTVYPDNASANNNRSNNGSSGNDSSDNGSHDRMIDNEMNDMTNTNNNNNTNTNQLGGGKGFFKGNDGEMPFYTKVFFQNGDPQKTMDDIASVLKSNPELKKKYIYDSNTPNLKNKIHHVLYRCHELDMMVIVEIFKVMYFVGNAIMIRRINANMYIAITKIYYSLELYGGHDEEYMAVIDLVGNLVRNHMVPQSLLTKEYVKDTMDHMHGMADLMGMGVETDADGKYIMKDVDGNIGYEQSGQDDVPTHNLQVGGADVGTTYFYPLEDSPFDPDVAEKLDKATSEGVKQYAKLMKQYTGKYKDLPFVNDEDDDLLRDYVDPAEPFRKDAEELNRLVKGEGYNTNWSMTPGIYNNNARLVSQSGGAAPKLFTFDESKWIEVEGKDVESTLKELFTRCYVVQILFMIEFEKAMIGGSLVLIEYQKFYRLTEIYIIMLSLLYIISLKREDIMVPPAIMEDPERILGFNEAIMKIMKQMGNFTKDGKLKTYDHIMEKLLDKARVDHDPLLNQEYLVLLGKNTFSPIRLIFDMNPLQSRQFAREYRKVLEKIINADTQQAQKNALDDYNEFWQKLMNASTGIMKIWIEPWTMDVYDVLRDLAMVNLEIIDIYDDDLQNMASQAGGGDNNIPKNKRKMGETLGAIPVISVVNKNMERGGKILNVPQLSIDVGVYGRREDIKNGDVKQVFNLYNDKINAEVKSFNDDINGKERHDRDTWINIQKRKQKEAKETMEKNKQQARNNAERQAKYEAEEKLKQETLMKQKQQAEDEERIRMEQQAEDEERIRKEQEATYERIRKEQEAEYERIRMEKEAENERIRKEHEAELLRKEEELNNISENDFRELKNVGLFANNINNPEDAKKTQQGELFINLKKKYITGERINNVIGKNVTDVMNDVYNFYTTLIEVDQKSPILKTALEHLQLYKYLILLRPELLIYYLINEPDSIIKIIKIFTLTSFDDSIIVNDEMPPRVVESGLKFPDINMPNIDVLNERGRIAFYLMNLISSDYYSLEQKIGNDPNAYYWIIDKNIMPLYHQISITNEDILGQARIIVNSWDKPMMGGNFNENMTTIIKELENRTFNSYLESTNDRCIKLVNNDKSSQIYGVFDDVFINQNSKHIFDEKFGNKGGLIDETILKMTSEELKTNGNLVVFGYGFSGSGKTFLLLDNKNKENILRKTIDKLKGDVSKVNVTFQELYPVFVTKDDIQTKNKVHEYQIIDHKQYEYSPKNGKKFNETEFIEGFNEKFSEISQKRILSLRISPTPNNLESSRSHMFIVIEFVFKNGYTGKFTIIDMAGSENTIEIKQQFLFVPGLSAPSTKKYKYSSAKELYNKLDNSDTIPKKEHINHRYVQDAMGMRPIMARLFNTLTGYHGFQGVSIDNSLLKKRFANPSKINGFMGEKAFSIPNKGINVVLSVVMLEINMIFKKLDFSYNYSAPNGNEVEVDNISPAEYHKIISHFIEVLSNNNSGIFNNPNNNPNDLGFNKPTLLTKEVIGNILKQLDLKYLINAEIIHNHIGKVNIKNINGSKFLTNHADMSLYYEKSKKSFPESYIGNPFIAIFFAIENILSHHIAVENQYHKRTEYITDDKNKKETRKTNEKNKKEPKKTYEIILYAYHALLLKVIISYVNYIVKQGKGIVTTLEHLKYLFLYRSSSQIGLIKYNNLQPEDRRYNWSEERDLINKNVYYQISKEISTKSDNGEVKTETVSETVNMGRMKDAKMIDLLCEYSGTKMIWDNATVENGGYKIIKLPDIRSSKFVMIASILRGLVIKNGETLSYDATSINKYKSAAVATLEFANSITSGVGVCGDECFGPHCKKQLQGGNVQVHKKRRTKKRNYRGNKRSLQKLHK